MSKVNIYLADGFEEVEGLTVVDLLRRVGIDVDMVSIMGRKEITGARKIPVLADKLFEEQEEADMIVLPGGMPGTLHLKAYKPLAELIARYDQEGRYLAAICAAPTIYGELGLLKGKKATCYPGMEDKLLGASWQEQDVVVDGNFVTSRGMGTAIAFALTLVTILKDEATAAELANSIVYKW